MLLDYATGYRLFGFLDGGVGEDESCRHPLPPVTNPEWRSLNSGPNRPCESCAEDYRRNRGDVEARGPMKVGTIMLSQRLVHGLALRARERGDRREP